MCPRCDVGVVVLVIFIPLFLAKWPAGMLYLMIPVRGICITYFTLTDLLGWKKYKKTHQYEQPEGEILPDGGKAE